MKVVMFILMLGLVGCTISLQNISTNGKADDVVDSNQTADPTISPNIEIPLLK